MQIEDKMYLNVLVLMDSMIISVQFVNLVVMFVQLVQKLQINALHVQESEKIHLFAHVHLATLIIQVNVLNVPLNVEIVIQMDV